jgi:hypothetical protein
VIVILIYHRHKRIDLNDWLNKLCYSSIIIKVTALRMMSCARHIAYTGILKTEEYITKL